jgi:hypothetical protein
MLFMIGLFIYRVPFFKVLLLHILSRVTPMDFQNTFGSKNVNCETELQCLDILDTVCFFYCLEMIR